MITVEELRRKYPNPRVCSVDELLDSNGNDIRYCVGGALCNAVWSERSFNFPAPHELAEAMKYPQPLLSRDVLLEIAKHVIEENDAGNFDVAWAWLDKGLSA